MGGGFYSPMRVGGRLWPAPTLSLAVISSSIAAIKRLRFQSASDTLRLTMRCRSAGILFRSTGHNRLPYESDSIHNDIRLRT